MIISITNISEDILLLPSVDKGNFISVSHWSTAILHPNESASLLAVLPNTGYTAAYMDFLQSLSPIYSRIAVSFSYDEKVVPGQIQSLPLNELSGSIAYDTSPENNTGVYHGVTLNAANSPISPDRMPLFGNSSYVSLYSEGLNEDFNGSLGSVSLFIQVADLSIWSNSALGGIISLMVNDDTSFLQIYKGFLDNTLIFDYSSGGVLNQSNVVITPTPAPIHIALTWANGSSRISAYINGELESSNNWNPGVWEGDLNPVLCVLGVNDIVGEGWQGYISHYRLYDLELNAQEVRILSNL